MSLAQSGAYIPNGDGVVRSDVGSSRIAASEAATRNYEGRYENAPSNNIAHHEVDGHGVNHTEPLVNGIGHDNESSGGDTISPHGEHQPDEIEPLATAEVFPIPIHNRVEQVVHSYENRRVRVPDGRQFFTVLLKIRFKDTKISYSRMFASMTSMTERPRSNAGLYGDDFTHLHRLIEVRFNDIVARRNPAARRTVVPDMYSPFSRYTVEVDLSTGENPAQVWRRQTFQNYERGLIGPADTKFITNKLEEIILDAVETIDALVAEREIMRRSEDYNPRSVILDFEARRAFAEEKRNQLKICTLQANINRLIREREAAADARGAGLRRPDNTSSFAPVNQARTALADDLAAFRRDGSEWI